jgi:hypothetical protein
LCFPDPMKTSSCDGTSLSQVYNFLLYVPYQLERLIQFSLLLAVDAFLVSR